jgi:hypothetical protein
MLQALAAATTATALFTKSRRAIEGDSAPHPQPPFPSDAFSSLIMSPKKNKAQFEHPRPSRPLLCYLYNCQVSLTNSGATKEAFAFV